MMTLAVLLESVLQRLNAVQPCGEGWEARCPAHDDNRASLSIGKGDTCLLLYCHAGCAVDTIVAAMGLTMCNLFVNQRPKLKRAAVIAIYPYHNADSALLFEVVRRADKTFTQRRPRRANDDAAKLRAARIHFDQQWVWSTKGEPSVLFHLPRLRAASLDTPVYIVEGEKDVLALEALGLVATTNPRGAGKWRNAFSEEFLGRRVIVLSDNDDAGHDHANSVVASVVKRAVSVRRVNLPGLPPKGDVSDWLAAGGTREALEALVADTLNEPAGAAAGSPGDPATPKPLAAETDDIHTYPEHLTDLGNARRLVRLHGNDIRHSCMLPHGGWLVWDGTRWVTDAMGATMRLAKAVVLERYREAEAIEDDTLRKAALGRALKSQQAERLRACLALASTEATIPIAPDVLDADTFFLNVTNGILDLRTGMFARHRREALCTKLAPVAYDPNATAPLWKTFLHTIFAGDAPLIGFVQRMVGYALTADTRERLLFVLYGTGRNGKSTFLETVRHVLGDDYACSTPSQTLLERRDDAIPNDIARLRGMRLVTASETRQGCRLNEATVKSLTGGDTISARFMRAEWFDFKPSFKIMLATNHKPMIRETDQAIWDRLRVVPFDVRIRKADEDLTLGERLRRESSGILTWAVEGCLEWQRHGLGPVVPVRTATRAYQAQQDLLARFLDDCCIRTRGARTTAGVLYATYLIWCTAEHEHPITKQAFGESLAERGFESIKGTKGIRLWGGIRLRDKHSGGAGGERWRGNGFDTYARAGEENIPESAPPDATCATVDGIDKAVE